MGNLGELVGPSSTWVSNAADDGDTSTDVAAGTLEHTTAGRLEEKEQQFETAEMRYVNR